MHIKQLSVNVQKKQLETVLEKTYSYNLGNALKNNYWGSSFTGNVAG